MNDSLMTSTILFTVFSFECGNWCFNLLHNTLQLFHNCILLSTWKQSSHQTMLASNAVFSAYFKESRGFPPVCPPPPRNIYPSLEFGTKYSPIMCAQKWVYCPTYTCITLHKRYLVMWKQVQIHKNRTPSAIPRLFTPQIYCKLISPW